MRFVTTEEDSMKNEGEETQKKQNKRTDSGKQHLRDLRN